MIKQHQFAPAFGLPNTSPFCVKLENYLRMTGLPLELVNSGDPLEAALTPAERAVATAFQRLFEENLYWAVVHTRWVQPAGWALTRPAFFGAMPIPLRWIVPPLARRGLRVELRGHGMGRHSAAEIHAIGCRDITAVADFLADKPFMLGAQPTSLDATAYALLANVLWVPLDSPICDAARARPALQAFCERIKARYYA